MSDTPTNAERAARFLATLEFYKAEQLGEGGPAAASPECVTENMTDLFTDFYHWYREEFGETPEDIIRVAETSARNHYEAERAEEGQAP